MTRTLWWQRWLELKIVCKFYFFISLTNTSQYLTGPVGCIQFGKVQGLASPGVPKCASWLLSLISINSAFKDQNWTNWHVWCLNLSKCLSHWLHFLYWLRKKLHGGIFWSHSEAITKVGHCKTRSSYYLLKQLLLSVFMLCLKHELYRYLFLKVEESGGIRGWGYGW